MDKYISIYTYVYTHSDLWWLSVYIYPHYLEPDASVASVGRPHLAPRLRSLPGPHHWAAPRGDAGELGAMASGTGGGLTRGSSHTKRLAMKAAICRFLAICRFFVYLVDLAMNSWCSLDLCLPEGHGILTMVIHDQYWFIVASTGEEWWFVKLASGSHAGRLDINQ